MNKFKTASYNNTPNKSKSPLFSVNWKKDLNKIYKISWLKKLKLTWAKKHSKFNSLYLNASWELTSLSLITSTFPETPLNPLNLRLEFFFWPAMDKKLTRESLKFLTHSMEKLYKSRYTKTTLDIMGCMSTRTAHYLCGTTFSLRICLTHFCISKLYNIILMIIISLYNKF